MLRITLRNIRNLVSYEGSDTLCIQLHEPPPTAATALVTTTRSDLEALRREKYGTCPIRGSYIVYEDWYLGEGWVPIGMKQRGRWLWGKDRVCRGDQDPRSAAA